MNDNHHLNKLEHDYITDGIYIGTNQCCQTHFEEKLKREGINADISLEEDRVDTPFGVDFYIWIPVKDHTPPSEDQLKFGVASFEQLVLLRKKIYVHCRNGHGRTPTLVAAYLIRQGKTPKQALDLIKNKRTTIHLDEKQKQSLDKYFKILDKRATMLLI